MALPALVGAAVVGFLAQAATALVGRVLIALGIGFVTFTGVNVLLNQLRDLFLSYVSGLPAWAVSILALCKIGACFSMILSTVAIKATISGVTGGSIRKMVQK